MLKIALILSKTLPKSTQEASLLLAQDYAREKRMDCTIELATPPFDTHYDVWLVSDRFQKDYLACPTPQRIISLNVGYHDLVAGFPSIKVERVLHPLTALRMARYVSYFVLDDLMDRARWERQQQNTVWDSSAFPSSDDHRTIGILGPGLCGTAIAKALLALGFKVISYQRTKNHPLIPVKHSLEALLAESNILINALPDVPDTQNILNRATLSLLPKDSFFINVGRGGQVNEQDLLALLEEKHLRKAVLDVFHEEPLPPSHPFWKAENLHITPHISGRFSIMDVIPAALERMTKKNDPEVV